MGRKKLYDKKRKMRSIKMTDEEWNAIPEPKSRFIREAIKEKIRGSVTT